MAYKARTESLLLKSLRILNTRMELTKDDRIYYLALEKGFKGEVQFDLLTDKLQSDCLILNDLLLEFNKTQFQSDTLLIYQSTIFLIDVKNNEGDYCYETDNFRVLSGKATKNPLNQLSRCKSLLQQLLENLGCNLTIEAYVVFINPEFTLYQAPTGLPFIFPTQVNSFIKKLESKSSHLNNYHKILADKLVSLHQTDSAHNQLPTYTYQQLKKGITCKTCHSFSVSVIGKNIVCGECGCEELVVFAVIRCVGEVMLLFPNRKITTNEIYEWCKVIKSKKRINRILSCHYKTVGVRQWTFFEKSE
jgi:hypothetical protein